MNSVLIRAALILAFSLTLSSVTYSQLMPYRQYTVKDGLPSSNIYSITQDSTGFIWLGTDNGLCRFDGYEFVTIDEVGEMGQNEIISVFHYNNHIIAGCYNSDLFEIENFNQLYKYKMPQSNTYDKIISFKDNVVILNMAHSLIKYNTSNKTTNSIQSSIDSSYIKPLDISINNSGIVAVAHSNKIEFVDLDSNTTKIKPFYVKAEKVNCLQWKCDSSIYYSMEGNIYLLNIYSSNVDTIFNDSKIDKIKKFDISNNSIYMISDYPNSLYYYNLLLSSKNASEIALDIKTDLNCIFTDQKGGVWAGTSSSGLIYMKKEGIKEIYQVPEELGSLNVIHNFNEDCIYMGCKNGLGILKKGIIQNPFPELQEEQNYIRDIASKNSEVYVSTINTNITKGPFSYTTYVIDSISNIHFVPSASITNYTSDTLAIGNWQGDVDLVTLEKSKINYIRRLPCNPGFNNETRNRVNDIFVNKSGIYAATEQGLFWLQLNKTHPKKLSSRVINEIIKKDDNSLLGIHNNGFVKIFDRLQTVDFSSPFIVKPLKLNYLFIDDNQNWWFASNMGVYVFSKSSQNIYKFSTSNGLPENEVRQIMKYQGDIILATRNYLVRLTNEIDWDAVAKMPNVYLVQLDSYLDDGVTKQKGIIREYVRSLTIKYTTFSYTNPEALTYKYSVDGSDWVTTKSNEIEISSLGYGEHDIEIMASYYGGKFGPKSTIEVYMMPPIWRSYFFYLLSLFSISAFIYHVLKSRQGILKYHSRGFLHNQLLIENLKTRSGVNNLNPHFIYNALNSIKDFLKKNSLKNSFSYIDQFSKLIRLNISGSQEMGVSVHDEIKRLKHYLDLEKLRHNIPFDYEFTVDRKVDMKLTWIPSMVIQPFIENITWYGLQEPIKKGEIKVAFVRDGENILVHIRDNGIGIEEARRRQIKHHKSLGTRLVLSKLSSLDPFTDDIVIVRKASEQKTFPGTWVTITLTPRMFMELKRRKLNEK